MFKRVSLLLLIVFCTAILMQCGGGGGKYSELASVLDDMIKAQEEYIDDLNKVNNAAEAAKAIDNFANKMVAITPKMKDIEKKYPELKTQKEPPKELRGYLEKLSEVGGKLGKVSAEKMAQYATDPDVQKAAQRLAKTMQ